MSRSIKRSFIPAVLVLSFLAFAVPTTAHAQSDDDVQALKSEIESLKKGQLRMQRELTEIRRLLQHFARQPTRAQRPEPFKPFDLTVANSPSLGEAGAPVTIVEFTDYQCPFCRRHSTGTKKQLVSNFVDTGKLRYVMREFPIESIHPKAFRASEAALCAGDQGKYWEMYEVLFANQRTLAPSQLKTHAARLGLDENLFNDCFDNAKYANQVRRDLKDGAAASVRGTPSFLLGVTDPDNPHQFKATRIIRGAQSLDIFQREIDALLAEAAKGS